MKKDIPDMLAELFLSGGPSSLPCDSLSSLFPSEESATNGCDLDIEPSTSCSKRMKICGPTI